MRKLITKFMVINVGANWVKENTPDNLTEYVTENKTGEILYKFNFLELRSYLFDEFAMKDMNDFIKGKNQDDSFTIKEIDKYLSKSNWDRYFNEFEQCLYCGVCC